jgi:hypothetical protein
MNEMYKRRRLSSSTVVLHVNRWNWKRGIFESNPPTCPIWGIELRRLLSAAFAFAYRVKRTFMVYVQIHTHNPPMHDASNCHTSNSERQRRVPRSHTAALLVCADQRPRVAIKYRLQSCGIHVVGLYLRRCELSFTSCAPILHRQLEKNVISAPSVHC